VILSNKNKEETVILFSEVNKIYIRKSKFSFLNKIGLVSVLLIITAVCSVYLPMEIVLPASILFIPLIVKMHTYKKYRLHIQLCDGTFFIKGFNKSIKQEYINLVNVVRKEIFDNQIRTNVKNLNPTLVTTIVEGYTFSALSIT
jgi:hypothetical protein